MSVHRQEQPLKQNTMEADITITSEQLQDIASQIANSIAERVAINTKPVLTFKEACLYTGLSTSNLYKLTMEDVIPHYKPNGKRLYFKRVELDEWLLQNRCATDDELEDEAQHYTNTNRK